MSSPNNGDKSSENINAEKDDAFQVSFAGKGLKLDTQDDATDIVDAIRSCPKMVTLNLEGNTLGVEAASAISQALETASCFKCAIWRDLFTGRLKSEIPEALTSLSRGIILSNTRLTELDLSDNAFGPIGMGALVKLLEHEACEELEILRLNNNGLGISGGKTLGQALQNLPHLEVFICGRNRLENSGATAIAGALAKMNKLRQIEMPQNGIYLPGIEAITKAISENLKILNLSDNTMTVQGARVMAPVLKKAQNLQVLNLGDCLLETEGFTIILKALREYGVLSHLQQINFQGNEIGDEVIDLITETFSDPNISALSIDVDLSDNNFGRHSRRLLREVLHQKDDEENRNESDDDDDYDDDDESDESYQSDDEAYARTSVEDSEQIINSYLEYPLDNLCRDFVHLASEQFDPNAMSLHVITLKDLGYILQAIVNKDNSEFQGVQSLLVHMGLIKSEEGYHKKNMDWRGPFIALKQHVNLLPKSYRDVLQLFLNRYDVVLE